MTNAEMVYLGAVILAFVSFAGMLAWVSAGSRGPDEPV